MINSNINVNNNEITSTNFSPENNPEVDALVELVQKLPSLKELDCYQKYQHNLNEQEKQKYLATGKELLESLVDKDSLIYTHPSYLDDKLFAHIHADSYAGDTPLEGNQFSRTLAHMTCFLKKHASVDQEEIDLIEKSCQISEAMNTIEKATYSNDSKVDALKQLSKNLAQQILEKPKTVLLPGGYKGASSGHALIYQIDFTSNGTLTLSIFNTGDGLQYHKSQGMGGKIKVTPILCYENISPDENQLRLFLQAALECQVLEKKGETPYSSEFLYDKVFSILQGQKNLVKTGENNIITTQNAGMCSERVIHAYIRHRLFIKNEDMSSYKDFKVDYKRQTLINYFMTKKSQGELGKDTPRILLEKAIYKFARAVDKRLKQNAVNDATLEQDIALLEAMRNELAIAKEDKASLMQEKIPIILNDPDEPCTLVIEVKGNFFTGESQDQKISAPAEFSSLRPQLKTTALLNDIFEWNAYVNSYANNPLTVESSREILGFFQEAMACLPAVDSNEFAKMIESYSSASESSLNRVLTCNEITLFLQSIFQAQIFLRSQSGELIPMGIPIYYAKGIYALFRLARLDPKNKLENYSLDISITKLSDIPCFVLQDVKLSQEFSQLMSVLEKDKQGHTLLDINPSIIKDSDLSDTSSSSYFFSKFVDPALSNYWKSIESAATDTGGLRILPSDIANLKKTVCFLGQLIVSSTPESQNNRGEILQRAIKTPLDWVEINLWSDGVKLIRPKEIDLSKCGFINHFPRLSGLRHLVEKNGKASKNTVWNQNVIASYKNLSHVSEEGSQGKLSLEEAKDFESLLVDRVRLPYNTIALFENHLTKLSDPEIQEFFLIRLFNTEAFVPYLKAHPEFAEHLASFVNRGFGYFESINKPEHALFFLQLSEKLQQFVAEIHPKSNVKFLNRHEQLTRWFDEMERSEVKSQVALHLLSSFSNQKTLSLSDVSLFLQVHSYFRSYPVEKTNDNPHLKYEMERALFKFMKSSAVIDQHPTLRNEVSNRILELVVGDRESLEWEGTYPHLKAIKATGLQPVCYEIDLSKGMVLVNGKLTQALPEALTRLDHYRSLFEDRKPILISQGKNLYQIWDPANPSIEVLADISTLSGTDAIFLFKLDGEWVRSIPSTEIIRLKNGSLTRKGHNAWRTASGDVIITDDRGKKIYVIDTDEPPVQSIARVVKSITRVSDGAKLVSHHLDKAHTSSFLEGFEDRKWISCWMKESDDATKKIELGTIELPRFHLEFEVRIDSSGQQKTGSKAHPGYYLINPKSSSTLGLNEPVLLLENEKGERKVCYARQVITKTIQEGDAFSGNTARRKSEESETDQKYYLFDVDANENLVGHTPEEHLYLAYIYLSKSPDPEMMKLAHKEILAIRMTRPFTLEENQLLDWILSSGSSTCNKDPDAVAIRLKIAVLREENRNTFKDTSSIPIKPEKDIETEFKHFQELFIYLLKSNQNTLVLKLKQDEELLLIKQIQRQMPLSEELVRLLKARKETESGALERVSNQTNKRSYLWMEWDKDQLQREFKIPLSKSVFTQDNEWFSQKAAFATPLTHSKECLMSSFKAFYEIASDQQADPSARAELKVRLDLLVLEDSEKNLRQLRDILKAALTRPEEFSELKFPVDALNEKPDANNYKVKMLSENGKKFFAALASLTNRVNQVLDREKNEKIESNDELKKRWDDFKYPADIIEDIREKSLIAPEKKEGIAFSLKPSVNVVKNAAYFVVNEESESHQLPLARFEFNCKSTDPVVNTYLGDYNEDLKVYYQNKSTAPKKISVKETALLRKEMKAKIDSQEEQLRHQETIILNLINRLPDDKHQRLMTRLNLLGQGRSELTMKQSIGLFLRGDQDSFQRMNPALTKEDLSLLMTLISNFLVEANDQKKGKRILELLDHLHELEHKVTDGKPIASDASEIILLKNKIAVELTTPRQYEATKSLDLVRTCQVFEYLSDIQIRDKQINLVDNILSGKIGDEEREFIAQLIMGGGKSKVILPILAQVLANGERLVLLVVPKTLIDVQKQYMSEVSGGLFDQEANTFEFDRETEFSVESLKEVHDNLIRVINNREYLIITPETLQAIELRYIECRKLLGGEGFADEEIVAKTNILGNILRLFRTKTTALIDEADTVLDPLHELNFTIDETAPIDKEHLHFNRKIYEVLSQDPGIRELIHLRENEPILQVKERIPAIMKKLAQHFSAQFCNTDEERKLFVDYVTKDASIKSIPSFINRKNVLEKELIGLLRGQICTFLPLTLSHPGYQDYCFSKTGAVDFAIPAHKSQPVEGSQFGNHFEAINYTLQFALKEGVNVKQLSKAINLMKKQANLEMKNGVALRSTTSYEYFKKLYPGKDLFVIEKEDLPAIVEHMNKQEDILFEFVERYLISQIELYPTKMSSDSIRLVSMFNKVYGVTGTPWNSHCYHERFGEVVLDKGTEGLSIDLLLQKEAEEKVKGNSCVHLVILPKVNLSLTKKAQTKRLVEQLFDSIPKETHAIIDTGALLKGLDSLHIAKEMLNLVSKKAPPLNGVVFFYQNALMVLESGKKRPIPFEQTDLKPAEYFSYYDDAHTIGADILQKFDAKAVVTISDNLHIKDLLQAAWRMRGLANNQTVNFLVSKECQDTINKELNKAEDSPATVTDILNFTGQQQAVRQGEDTLRSVKEKMTDEIIDIVLHEVLKTETEAPFEAQELFNVFSELNGLLLTHLENQPFEQFGSIEQEGFTIELLNAARNQWISQIDEAVKKKLSEKGISPLFKQLLLRVQEEITQALESVLLPVVGRIPEKTIEQGQVKLGSEIEVQKQVEQNTETQTKTAIETQTEDLNQGSKTVKSLWEWGFIHNYVASFGLEDIQESKVTQISPSKDTTKIYHCPFFRLEEVIDIEKNRVLAPLSEFLKENPSFRLLVTNNFHTVIPKEGESPSIFFGKQQKPINKLLLNLSRDNKLSICLVSEDDMKEIGSEMENNRKNPSVALFDLRTNKPWLPLSGKMESFLRENPQFQAQLVLLRLMNGEIDYTDEQLRHLEGIIRKMGPGKFLKLFSRIVSNRDSAKSFEGSVLQMVIQNNLSEERLVAAKAERLNTFKALQEERKQLIHDYDECVEKENQPIGQSVQSQVSSHWLSRITGFFGKGKDRVEDINKVAMKPIRGQGKTAAGVKENEINLLLSQKASSLSSNNNTVERDKNSILELLKKLNERISAAFLGSYRAVVELKGRPRQWR